LGAGLGAVVAGGDGVGGPVVVHHLGVVDRDVGGPLLEVVDRGAAVAHARGDQPVGRAGGLGRLVDELGLGVAPGLEVAGAGLGLERDDVEALATLGPVGRVGLGGAGGAGLLHRTVVLGPELVL